MQRGHCVVEHVIGPGLVLLLLTLLARRERGLALLARKPATQFHQPRRVLRHRRRELHKLAVFPLQREAQLVLSPLRIGTQRGNRTISFHLERPGVPLHRRAVQLRRTPALNMRSEEHTSELQSLRHLVCRLLLEKKKKKYTT